MCKMSGCCISVLLGWGMLVSFNFLFLFVCLFVLGAGCRDGPENWICFFLCRTEKQIEEENREMKDTNIIISSEREREGEIDRSIDHSSQEQKPNR